MKLLIAGDTHGNLNQFHYLHFVMQSQGITRGIVLGDFGLWPGPKGEYFLHELENICKDDDITWSFLDGNHEDHTQIQEWMQEPDAYDRVHQVRPHVYYLPRGYRFDVDGCWFMSLGGAWSIDQDSRVPYVSWWPEEELTYGDVIRAMDGDPIDVLLTHDMPDHQEAITAFGSQMHPGGRQNRQAVSAVIDEYKPKLHLHGHMHRRVSALLCDTGTQVEGLDCDGSGAGSWLILDTNDWKSNE